MRAVEISLTIVWLYIGMTCEHAVSRKQFGSPLAEFGLIQVKWVKVNLRTCIGSCVFQLDILN